MPLLLALNSDHFRQDILPAAQRELSGHSPNNSLYEAIRQGDHKILVTKRWGNKPMERECILRHYHTELQRWTPQLASGLINIVKQLEETGLIVSPPFPHAQLNGLPRYHRVLLEDAIAGRVNYFVTERPEWLNLNGNRGLCREMEIITADAFVLRHGNQPGQARHHRRSRNRP